MTWRSHGLAETDSLLHYRLGPLPYIVEASDCWEPGDDVDQRRVAEEFAERICNEAPDTLFRKKPMKLRKGRI